jgi:2',3'-cyclic-nucleotide 2'-phosphodiesterase (5'-nucleotidase family)
VVAFGAACTAPASKPTPRPTKPVTGGPIHLVVLHTNDMHGQVLPRKATWLNKDKPPLIGGIPRVAAYITQARRELAAQQIGVVAVDGGDWYQGTPEGLIDNGLDYVRAVAAVGYDAAALGNHEFDHGLDNIKRLLGQAKPPAICCNVRVPTNGERVDWVEPWRIVEVRGLRIALVGLLTPATPSITHKDARRLIFEDVVDAVTRAKAELEGQYDLLIPVGHIGIDDGVRIAKAHPDLPLVVTGHSHTYLKEGQREGATLIVQAGSKASAVGRVDLWLDLKTHAVIESRARLDDLLEEPESKYRNAKVERIGADLVARSADEMKEVVGELTAKLSGGRGPASTVAGNWVADLIRVRAGADVGLHNRGGTRAEIEPGPVTRRAVFEVLPFDNDVVSVELTGTQLERLVRRSIEGTAHSGLDFSGMRVFVKSYDDKGQVRFKLERLEVGGRRLEPSKRYRVATNSFLAGGGDAFEELANAPERIEDPILLRDLAVEEFKRLGKITPPSDARIVIVAPEKP